ncbi:MAG: 4Fe-4S dicluster domain-containing protein [Thermoplasmata archaeon]|nr:MAG: 4Fe-4S dicluster domain-containing protein [Thermoplasmata archaeon]
MPEDTLEDYPLVTDDDIDPEFAQRVASTPGGEHILDCYACGTCSASCPIRAIDDEFNPRRIIRLALLGLKDEVLQSEFIWLCTGCYICQERCPQDVRITELMTAFRNVAVEEGYPHPTVKAIADMVAEHGIIMEIGEFENDKREKIGLPARNVPSDVHRPILEDTGLTDALAKAKGKPKASEEGGDA